MLSLSSCSVRSLPRTQDQVVANASWLLPTHATRPASQKRPRRSRFRGHRRRQDPRRVLELGRFEGDSGGRGNSVVALGKVLYVTRSERPAEYLNIDPS